MRSGAPWHLKGVRPEARDSAREAARRAGMSVGQWLNSVILDSTADESDADVYDDPYAPPALRRDSRDERGGELTAIADRIDDLTAEVERLSRVARPSRDGGVQDDAIARKLAEAIAALDRRVENSIQEGRNATRALGLKVESVDRALTTLGRERVSAGTSDWSTSVDQAVDEIAQRQRELDRETAVPANGRASSSQSRDDFAAIHDQLRRMSEQVDTFGAARMRDAIDSLRNDLAEIAGKLTAASPRSAIEALEGEVRALAAKLDAGRRSGDGPDLSSLQSGLAEVRDAIRTLTPAESLSGAVEAIQTLSKKIDQMAAGAQDPGAMQQLEAAISGLRGIVSRVASDDSLAALTAEVRTLSEKINSGSGHAGGSEFLQMLEQRIGTIADAIESVRTSAGGAVVSAVETTVKSLGDKIERIHAASNPQGIGAELGTMIGSLGERIERMHAAAGSSPFAAMVGSLTEKIEQLQASRGGDALHQIEHRIGAFFQKLEASEAKLGNLDSIERGMKELLTHLESLRGRPAVAPSLPGVGQSIVNDVLRTQDSLEAAHGTIGDVVDRLAMIETGMRGVASPPLAPAQPSISAIVPPAKPAPAAPMPVVTPAAALSPAATRPPLAPQAPPSPTRPAAAIDDILPHDHPLEPGSGKPRPGMSAPMAPQASPAERIAASMAVAEPPRGPSADPDAKSSFIVAARRAAQAAAEDTTTLTSRAAAEPAVGKTATGSPMARIGKHLKTILVGASVIAIIAGAIHLAASFFYTAEAPAEAPATQSKLLAPDSLARSTPVVGSSGVLNETVAPAGTASTNAGVLPQVQPRPPSPTPALPVVAPMPERTDTAPPAAAPPPPSPDVTGTLVPRTPPAAATSSLFTAPQAGRSAPLPIAIGGKTLLAAAEGGDAAAAYEIATRYADGRGVSINPEAAATWFERAARAGLVPAMFRLGGHYEKGVGVKKDLNRARELYAAAAERGNAKAMHNLAVLYADGFEGKPDYATAIQWFRKAAARGVPDSQYNLGVLYARGIGVEQNFGESFRWFALAAQSGDQDAAQKRDDVAKRLDAQTLSAVRANVQSWTPDPQPDDAVTVKVPPGGWDPAPAPAAAKAKSKRVQSGGAPTAL